MEEKTQEIAVVEGLLIPFGEPNILGHKFIKGLLDCKEIENCYIYGNDYNYRRYKNDRYIGVPLRVEEKDNGIYLDSMIYDEKIVELLKRECIFGYQINGNILEKNTIGNTSIIEIIEFDLKYIIFIKTSELIDQRCICRIKVEKDV